eukprot:1044213-Amphidinium_carterae.1
MEQSSGVFMNKIYKLLTLIVHPPRLATVTARTTCTRGEYHGDIQREQRLPQLLADHQAEYERIVRAKDALQIQRDSKNILFQEMNPYFQYQPWTIATYGQ